MLSRYLLLVSLVAVIASCSGNAPQQNGVATDQQILGLPFEIKYVNRYDSIDKWYIVTLVLPRQYYSKENLERIFQYYSGKNPDLARIVRVMVFADPETYERSRSVKEWEPPKTIEQRKESDEEPSVPKPYWNNAHAHYDRQCQNEHYWYSPDLDDPSKQETVILKGKLYGMPIMNPCK